MNAELIQCASNPSPLPNPIIADSAKSAESVPSKRKTKTKSIVGFDEWYAIYPKHVARGDAAKAYSKAIGAIAQADNVPAEQAHSLLLRWTKDRLPSINATETQFRPHPASWLNAERYRDEITTRTIADALAQLPQQLALGVGKDWNCDFFSHYISLVLILAGSRNPSMSSRIF